MELSGITKLFGLVLASNKIDAHRVFAELKREWCETPEHQTIYDLMLEIFSENEDITLISMAVKIRSKGIDNKFIAILSGYSSSLHNQDFIQVDSIIQLTRQEYLVRMTKYLNHELTNGLKTSKITTDFLKKILDKGISVINEGTNLKRVNVQDDIEMLLNRHEQAKNGNIQTLNLGYHSMKENIQLEPVDMMVVGARPAMGKTSFMVATLVRLVFNEKKKVVLFNLEMSNVQILRRILSNLTGISSRKMKLGQCSEADILKINQIKELPEWQNLIIYEGSHTINQISMKLSDLKLKDMVDVFIVDYLQKITPEKGTNRFYEVTTASNGLKFICQNMQIPCIALAQLGRANEQRGGDKRPVLSDLRDSGEIEQDASIVMFLHRPEYYGIMQDENGDSNEGKAEGIIAKNRDGEVGMVKFYINLAESRWEDGHNEVVYNYNPDEYIEQKSISFGSGADFFTQDNPF